MYEVILKLDKFFLKYNGEMPSLIRVKYQF